MYDMYPDSWSASDAQRRSVPAGEPRRRARKPHSVVPSVIARQVAAVQPPAAAS